MWERIADDIPQPKRKRRPFGWFFLGGLALVIWAGWSLNMQTEDSHINHIITSSFNATPTSGIQTAQALSTPTNQTSKDNHSALNQGQAIKESNSSSTDIENNVTTGRTPLPLKESNVPNDNQNREEQLIDHPVIPEAQKELEDDLKQKASEGPKEDRIYASALPGLRSVFAGPLNGLPVLPISTFENVEEVPNLGEYQLQTSPRKKWNLLAGIFTGISSNDTRWSSSSDEGRGWLARKKATETGLETVSVGIRAEIISPLDVGFETGIQYHKHNDVLNVKLRNSVTEVHPLELEAILQDQDTTIRTYDYVTTKSERNVTHYNYRSTITIPLNLTYRKVFKGWILGAAAGVALTLPWEQSGKSVNYANDQILSWSDQSEWAFNDQPTLSYQGRLSVGRQFGNGFIVSFEPSINVNHGAIIDSPYDISSTTTNMGFNLGVSKFLF